jgi:hypothetical protein
MNISNGNINTTSLYDVHNQSYDAGTRTLTAALTYNPAYGNPKIPKTDFTVHMVFSQDLGSFTESGRGWNGSK